MAGIYEACKRDPENSQPFFPKGNSEKAIRLKNPSPESRPSCTLTLAYYTFLLRSIKSMVLLQSTDWDILLVSLQNSPLSEGKEKAW